MVYRKNVKRIDPRYFLDETVNRGEELEETALNENEQLKALMPKIKQIPINHPSTDAFKAKYARKANLAAGRDKDDAWGEAWVSNMLTQPLSE